MALHHIRIGIEFWSFEDEERDLVIDGAVLGAIEARAVAQSLTMARKDLPPPKVTVEIDIDGVMTEIDPEVWQEERQKAAEEESDG